MQSGVPSHEALLQGVVSLGACLHPTVAEGRGQELKDDLTRQEERFSIIRESIAQR